jgi:uncharacterized protein (TIGR03083 family)
MDVRAHVSALEHEGRLLADAARAAGMDAAVPSCPGWRTRDLLAHVGFVHRWATAYVGQRLTTMVDEPREEEILAAAPHGEEILDWFDEGHVALVEALGAAPEDLECWTFLPAPSPRAMWARRQAHETAVHRVDAELAAARHVSSVDVDFAVDGVDEVLNGFLSRRRPGDAPTPIGLLELRTTDANGAWMVRLLERGLVVEEVAHEPDARILGPAFDIYRFLWNRLDASAMTVVGSAELVTHWRERYRIRW